MTKLTESELAEAKKLDWARALCKEIGDLKYTLTIEMKAKRKLVDLCDDLQRHNNIMRKKILELEGPPESTSPHGRSRYSNEGCRCDICRDDYMEYQRGYRRAKRQKTPAKD